MMAALLAWLVWSAVQAPAATDSLNRFLYVESPSEVVVTVRAGCFSQLTCACVNKRRPSSDQRARCVPVQPAAATG